MDEQNLTTVTDNTVFAPRNRLNELQYEYGRNDPARGPRVNRPERARVEGYEARNDWSPDISYWGTSYWNNHYCEYLEQEIKELRRFVEDLAHRICDLESMNMHLVKEMNALKDSVWFKYFEWDDYDG